MTLQGRDRGKCLHSVNAVVISTMILVIRPDSRAPCSPTCDNDFYEIRLGLSEPKNVTTCRRVIHKEHWTLREWGAAGPTPDWVRVLFSPEVVHSVKTFDLRLLAPFRYSTQTPAESLGLSPADFGRIGAAIGALSQALVGTGYGQDVIATIRLVELLAYIGEIGPTCSGGDNPTIGLVSSVREHIRTHLSESLGTARLAAVLGVDANRLGSQFYASTGLSIRRYVQLERIGRAKNLLARDQPVSSVAEQVGYSNVASFIRAFRGLTGTSPKRYTTALR